MFKEDDLVAELMEAQQVLKVMPAVTPNWVPNEVPGTKDFQSAVLFDQNRVSGWVLLVSARIIRSPNFLA